MHDPIDLSYLAGAIDADGCIGIFMNTHNIRHRKDGTHSPVYVPRLSLGQVDIEAVALAAETFGGPVNKHQPKGNRKPMNIWKRDGGKSLTPILQELIPYLRIKRDRAENVLELIGLQNQLRWPKIQVVPGEPMISASEFSRRVGIDRSTVGNTVTSGMMPHTRAGRDLLIPESFVEEYKHRKSIGFSRRRCPDVAKKMEACYIKARALNGVGLTPHIPAIRHKKPIPSAHSSIEYGCGHDIVHPEPPQPLPNHVSTD